MCCRGLQRLANTAYLEGFPFPALLRVAPYCVPGGIRMVSKASVLRNSPTRKKASAACLFLHLHGVGYGLLELLRPPLFPHHLMDLGASQRKIRFHLGMRDRILGITCGFMQGLRRST